MRPLSADRYFLDLGRLVGLAILIAASLAPRVQAEVGPAEGREGLVDRGEHDRAIFEIGTVTPVELKAVRHQH